MLNVFVYGTLKPGKYNYGFYEDWVIEEIEAKAMGLVYDLSLGYPGMTMGDGWVRGYVLRFEDEEVLYRLDRLEGFDPNRDQGFNEYYRELIETYDEGGDPLSVAWVYLMTPERIEQYQGRLLPDGCWDG